MEKERERTIHIWLPLRHLLLRTWPATQACALMGNWTGDPLIHKPALNPLSHTSQGRTMIYFLYLFIIFFWLRTESIFYWLKYSLLLKAFVIISQNVPSFGLVICVIKSFINDRALLLKAPHICKIFSFQEILIFYLFIASWVEKAYHAQYFISFS